MKKTATMYKPSAKSNSKKLLKLGSMIKGWVGLGLECEPGLSPNRDKE